MRKHVYNGTDESSVNETGSSFIDQIRKKFNEQKYMKREDVLKLLRELQQ